MAQSQLQCLPGGGGANTPERPPDLAALYREHVRAVWRIARHLGARTQDLDDIVHDVFLIAHRRRHDVDPGRSIRNWLFGITRNVVMRSHSRAVRERRGLRAVPAPTLPEQPAAAEAVERQEAHDALSEFLEGLPADQREVFVLHEMEGEPIPAVAVLVGSNLNTIYSRLRLARRRFERFLARREAVRRRNG